MKHEKMKKLTVLAMLSAIAYVAGEPESTATNPSRRLHSLR